MKITDLNDAKAFTLKYWTNNPSDKEAFVVVNIAKQTVLKTVEIPMPFTLDDFFTCEADTIVIMHNSHEAMASTRDLELTHDLTREAQKRGIFLLDHVIYAGDVHSVRERITEIMNSPWYTAANGAQTA